MQLKNYVESLTGFKVKSRHTQTFTVLEANLFTVHYQIEEDALVIKWIQTFDPCNKQLRLGSNIVRGFKNWVQNNQLLLVASDITDAAPFWLKVGFTPIPTYPLDFQWTDWHNK